MKRLKNITIYNFRAFGNQVTFNFESKRLVLLTAPNGKGKTSLLDAIEWCLTGNVRRLQYAFFERNPSTEANLKINKQAILKNTNHLKEKVEISLEMDIDENTYKVTRIQAEDTLESPGVVTINGKQDEKVQAFLDSLFHGESYYKYHVCDMQKAYRFQRTNRSNMSAEFADFTQDHSKAEVIAENLAFFQEDIVKRIEELNQKKIDEKTLGTYKAEMAKHEKAPEILPYPLDILFDGELIIKENHTEDQLKSSLKSLYNYGYAYATSILETLSRNEKYTKIQTSLESLKIDFAEHEKEIKEAVKTEATKESVRKNAKRTMESLKELQQDLKLSTLDTYVGKIAKLGNDKLTQEYLDRQMKASEKVKKKISDFEASILNRKKGNEIIDTLSQIAAGENGLIAYRQKIRSEQGSTAVKCPVCGSDKFDKLTDDEIVKEAKNYVNTQDELITNEQKKLKEERQLLRTMRNEMFTNAQAAVREVLKEKENTYQILVDLNNTSKQFFKILKELQKNNKVTYSEERMTSADNIVSAMEENGKRIFDVEAVSQQENIVRRILALIDYSDKEKLKETELPIAQLLVAIKQRGELVPKVVDYNEELLQAKINSIRSRVLNYGYLNASKKLQEANKNNTSIEHSVQKLSRLSERAKEREMSIRSCLKDMYNYEFEQVGPYLYKIFRKLARDVGVSGIDLKGGRGDRQLQLVDENEHPILNMLSEGQLSVFMLSYFLGNAFRLNKKENFGVYFVDDVTSTMDDINMLAFLDLIKYQLSDNQDQFVSNNGVFSQFFFATCDNSLQEMFRYKMNQCGIDYKEIGTAEFERNYI